MLKTSPNAMTDGVTQPTNSRTDVKARMTSELARGGGHVALVQRVGSREGGGGGLEHFAEDRN